MVYVENCTKNGCNKNKPTTKKYYSMRIIYGSARKVIIQW